MTSRLQVATTSGHAQTEDRDIPGLRPLPPAVGNKFHVDGRVRHFPGNTIICHVPIGEYHYGLMDLFSELAALDFSSSFTQMPPSSWHMTVFEGICDQVRKPGHWPSDLGYDVPLHVCTEAFMKRLRNFPLESEPPYRLRIVGIEPLHNGIGLSYEPIDDEQNMKLRTLRDRLSALLGLRHANHDTYGFHSGLAYFTRNITAQQESHVVDLITRWAAQQPVVELGAPEFCTFSSMFRFDRQFHLGADQS